MVRCSHGALGVAGGWLCASRWIPAIATAIFLLALNSAIYTLLKPPAPDLCIEFRDESTYQPVPVDVVVSAEQQSRLRFDSRLLSAFRLYRVVPVSASAADHHDQPEAPASTDAESPKPAGVVLFLHGHHGNKGQANALATVLAAGTGRLSAGGGRGTPTDAQTAVNSDQLSHASTDSVHVFAADFSGGDSDVSSSSSSAFHRGLALAQAHFVNVCVQELLRLYGHHGISTVEIVAHSMGAVAARAATSLASNFVPGSIRTVFALNGPHVAHPYNIDSGFSELFEEMKRSWSDAFDAEASSGKSLGVRLASGDLDASDADHPSGNDAPRDPSQLSDQVHGSMEDVVFVSLSGGGGDYTIRPELTSLSGLLSPQHGFSALLQAVPGAWLQTSHDSIVNCGQFVSVLADSIVSLYFNPSIGKLAQPSDTANPASDTDVSASLAISDPHLRTAHLRSKLTDDMQLSALRKHLTSVHPAADHVRSATSDSSVQSWTSGRHDPANAACVTVPGSSLVGGFSVRSLASSPLSNITLSLNYGDVTSVIGTDHDCVPAGTCVTVPLAPAVAFPDWFARSHLHSSWDVDFTTPPSAASLDGLSQDPHATWNSGVLDYASSARVQLHGWCIAIGRWLRLVTVPAAAPLVDSPSPPAAAAVHERDWQKRRGYDWRQGRWSFGVRRYQHDHSPDLSVGLCSAGAMYLSETRVDADLLLELMKGSAEAEARMQLDVQAATVCLRQAAPNNDDALRQMQRSTLDPQQRSAASRPLALLQVRHAGNADGVKAIGTEGTSVENADAHSWSLALGRALVSGIKINAALSPYSSYTVTMEALGCGANVSGPAFTPAVHFVSSMGTVSGASAGCESHNCESFQLQPAAGPWLYSYPGSTAAPELVSYEFSTHAVPSDPSSSMPQLLVIADPRCEYKVAVEEDSSVALGQWLHHHSNWPISALCALVLLVLSSQTRSDTQRKHQEITSPGSIRRLLVLSLSWLLCFVLGQAFLELASSWAHDPDAHWPWTLVPLIYRLRPPQLLQSRIPGFIDVLLAFAVAFGGMCSVVSMLTACAHTAGLACRACSSCSRVGQSPNASVLQLVSTRSAASLASTPTPFSMQHYQHQRVTGSLQRSSSFAIRRKTSSSSSSSSSSSDVHGMYALAAGVLDDAQTLTLPSKQVLSAENAHALTRALGYPLSPPRQQQQQLVGDSASKPTPSSALASDRRKRKSSSWAEDDIAVIYGMNQQQNPVQLHHHSRVSSVAADAHAGGDGDSVAVNVQERALTTASPPKPRSPSSPPESRARKSFASLLKTSKDVMSFPTRDTGAVLPSVNVAVSVTGALSVSDGAMVCGCVPTLARSRLKDVLAFVLFGELLVSHSPRSLQPTDSTVQGHLDVGVPLSCCAAAAVPARWVLSLAPVTATANWAGWLTSFCQRRWRLLSVSLAPITPLIGRAGRVCSWSWTFLDAMLHTRFGLFALVSGFTLLTWHSPWLTFLACYLVAAARTIVVSLAVADADAAASTSSVRMTHNVLVLSVYATVLAVKAMAIIYSIEAVAASGFWSVHPFHRDAIVALPMVWHLLLLLLLRASRSASSSASAPHNGGKFKDSGVDREHGAGATPRGDSGQRVPFRGSRFGLVLLQAVQSCSATASSAGVTLSRAIAILAWSTFPLCHQELYRIPALVAMLAWAMLAVELRDWLEPGWKLLQKGDREPRQASAVVDHGRGPS